MIRFHYICKQGESVIGEQIIVFNNISEEEWGKIWDEYMERFDGNKAVCWNNILKDYKHRFIEIKEIWKWKK